MNERLAALGIARPAAAPLRAARPGALASQTVRLYESGSAGQRDGLCEIDQQGLRLSDARSSRAIAWPDARSISHDGSRVRVVTPTGPLAMAVTLDGVVEPTLARVFARVLEEGRAGVLAARTGALHELALGIDRSLAEFVEADDPVVPLAIGACAAFTGVILVAALPVLFQLAVRIEPAPGSFALLPRIALFDPRVIVAAFAASSAAAVALGRAVLGPSVVTWARGTLRGWHHNAIAADDIARRAVARLVLGSRIAAIVAAGALLTLVPSALARTVVDEQGIQESVGLPLLVRERAWSEVKDVVPLAVGFGERAAGFETTLVFVDGSRISTRGRDLAGGSERAFYDFAKARAR